MSVHFGRQLFVFVSGLDAMYEALVKKSEEFSDRAIQIPILNEMIKGGNGIVLNNYNTEWKSLRRFTIHSLRDFGMGKAILEKKILNEIKKISDSFKRCIDEPQDVSALARRLVVNVIFKFLCNHRFDLDDPKYEEINQMVRIHFEGSGGVTPSFFPKCLGSILFKKESDVVQRQIENETNMQKLMREFIKSHSESLDPKNIRDFIDSFLVTSNCKETKGAEFLTESNLVRVMLDIFLAGVETASSSLSWTLLYLAAHPNVQKKCQKEVDKFIGSRDVTWADHSKMVYMEATLQEVLRISVPAPLAIIHCTSRDTTLKGYDIPKGTIIVPSLYSVLKEPSIWKDPNEFRPERFIDDSAQLIKHPAFVQFSLGPRACLGESLARMELFLVTSQLLRDFTFSCWPGNKPSLEPTWGATNIPQPFKLQVRQRV